MKPAKILYFVDGPSPTAEDFEAAAALNATVVFRNAQAVPSEQHSLEICDGVAGLVPQIYADKFPSAEKAIKTKAKELSDLTSKVGDEQAPKSNGKKAEPAKADPPAPGAKTGAPAWTPNQ